MKKRRTPEGIVRGCPDRKEEGQQIGITVASPEELRRLQEHELRERLEKELRMLRGIIDGLNETILDILMKLPIATVEGNEGGRLDMGQHKNNKGKPLPAPQAEYKRARREIAREATKGFGVQDALNLESALERRTLVVRDVVDIKLRLGKEVYDSGREKRMFEHIRQKCGPRGLDVEVIEAMFLRITEVSRQEQKTVVQQFTETLEDK